MSLLAALQMTFRTFLARKGRTFLTMLGIMIGVSGVIVIIALGEGAQSLILGQVTKLGSNLLSIQPGKSTENGPPAAAFGVIITSLVRDDAQAIAQGGRVPFASAVNAMSQGAGLAIYGNKNADITLVGTDSGYPKTVNFSMEKGQFLSANEADAGANVAVIGSQARDDLFGADADPIGKIIKIKRSTDTGSGGVPFRVIGVIAKRGSAFFQNLDDEIFVPLGVAQEQVLGIRYLQFITVKVDSAEHVSSTISEITTMLKERHHIENDIDADFTMRNQAQAVNILSTITDALRLFLTAMAALALVVGGIGILNIMLVTVAERTREIGLRKALGATNSAVRNQFLLEAGALTAIGGIFGILLGSLLSYGAFVLMQSLGYDWAFVISPSSVILAVGVSVFTGILFGLYPAIKASHLNPIEALRYE